MFLLVKQFRLNNITGTISLCNAVCKMVSICFLYNSGCASPGRLTALMCSFKIVCLKKCHDPIWSTNSNMHLYNTCVSFYLFTISCKRGWGREATLAVSIFLMIWKSTAKIAIIKFYSNFENVSKHTRFLEIVLQFSAALLRKRKSLAADTSLSEMNVGNNSHNQICNTISNVHVKRVRVLILSVQFR